MQLASYVSLLLSEWLWALSCRQIATQTNLIMLAGYETTANTLAFCIYLLARHPHAQQQLLQEVDGFKVLNTEMHCLQLPPHDCVYEALEQDV